MSDLNKANDEIARLNKYIINYKISVVTSKAMITKTYEALKESSSIAQRDLIKDLTKANDEIARLERYIITYKISVVNSKAMITKNAETKMNDKIALYKREFMERVKTYENEIELLKKEKVSDAA